MKGLPFAGVLVACVGLEGVAGRWQRVAPVAWQEGPFSCLISASSGAGSARSVSGACRPLVGVGRGGKRGPPPRRSGKGGGVPVSDGSSLACSQSVSLTDMHGLKSEAIRQLKAACLSLHLVANRDKASLRLLCASVLLVANIHTGVHQHGEGILHRDAAL